MDNLQTEWPDTVPILNGNDIYKGAYGSPSRQTHCLVGWRDEIFDSEQRDLINNAIKNSIADFNNDYCSGIISYNDDWRTPRKTIARVWNRAMARLGYTEGNPEASNYAS